MPVRARMLLVALAAIGVGFFVVSTLLVPDPGPEARDDARRASPGTTQPGEPRDRRASLRSYAVSLGELQGLSPRARSGTRLELWVTWEPPVARRLRNELLVDEVVLDDIVPALSPDRPDTALLLIESARISDVLYADRFGSLSAIELP